MPVFYFYMTHRLSSQPCAQIVDEWGGNGNFPLFFFFLPPTKVCTSNVKIFSYAPHILCLTCVIRDGKQVDLQGAQRFVLFSMAHSQPTMGACHAVAWNAAESFILQLPVPFQEMFFFFLEVTLVCVHLRVSLARKQIRVTGNIPCQREGEWSCPRDRSDGRSHPLWCPSSPSRSHSCPLTLRMALTGRAHPSETSRQNTPSLAVTWVNLLAAWTADWKRCRQSATDGSLRRPQHICVVI